MRIISCSRKVKMSHRGKLGMSHSLGLRSAGVWHGLGGDERTRTSPRRGAGVGCCGPNDYDSCGGSDGRNETAGSPSGASVRKRRRRRPSPSGSWTAFQSSAGAARTTDGDRLCHGALSGLWADLCEPDASGTPWSRGFAGDAPQVDDRGRAMVVPQAAAAISSAAPSARTFWRIDSDRRERTSLVRRPWSAMHADRVHRRCDQPSGGASLRPVGERLRVFRDAEGLSGEPRTSPRLLFRQALDLPRLEAAG